MGISVTLKDDPELYAEILKEAERIVRNSDVKKLNQNYKNSVYADSKWKPQAKPDLKPKPRSGYCIRTGVEIPFNGESPLCFKAFSSWTQYGDGNYPEQYCHFSGEKSKGETSYAKPIMKKNWKEAQRVFGL